MNATPASAIRIFLPASRVFAFFVLRALRHLQTSWSKTGALSLVRKPAAQQRRIPANGAAGALEWSRARGKLDRSRLLAMQLRFRVDRLLGPPLSQGRHIANLTQISRDRYTCVPTTGVRLLRARCALAVRVAARPPGPSAAGKVSTTVSVILSFPTTRRPTPY